METTQSTLETPTLPGQKLVSFVREMFDTSYPNPDGDPMPPGPWDPVIRAALKRMASLYRWEYNPKPPKPNWLAQLYAVVEGAVPDPWQTESARPELWAQADGASLVALNPQPLPPVFLFAAALANQVIAETFLRHELIDIIGTETGGRSSGRINRFVDDWCGTKPRLKWPLPTPPPPWWRKELSAAQLVVMGVQFENAANTSFDAGLQKEMASAGAKFIRTGLSRMEG